MSQPGWLNANESRAYPLIDGEPRLLESSLDGPVLLPDTLLADAGFVMFVDANYDDAEHIVYLSEISRDGDQISIEFRSTAPRMLLRPLIFTRHIADAEFATELVESAPISDTTEFAPVWEGFLQTGLLDDLLAELDDGEVWTGGEHLQIEPAQIQNLSGGYVRSIALLNEDRQHATPGGQGVHGDCVFCWYGSIIPRIEIDHPDLEYADYLSGWIRYIRTTDGAICETRNATGNVCADDSTASLVGAVEPWLIDPGTWDAWTVYPLPSCGPLLGLTWHTIDPDPGACEADWSQPLKFDGQGHVLLIRKSDCAICELLWDPLVFTGLEGTCTSRSTGSLAGTAPDFQDPPGGWVLYVGNGDVSCDFPVEVSSSSGETAVELVSDAIRLNGVLRLVEGHNCALRQNPLQNSITIAASVGAGAGEPCEEVPLFAGEAPPAGSKLLSGGPACDEVIKTVNGAAGPEVTIKAGPGVRVTPDEAIPHKLIIDVDLHDLTVCESL